MEDPETASPKEKKKDKKDKKKKKKKEKAESEADESIAVEGGLSEVKQATFYYTFNALKSY